MKTLVCKADALGAFRSPAWPQGDPLRVTWSEPPPPALGSGPPFHPKAFQQRENLLELMFILVTPMSLSGVERLKEDARGESQKRSDSSSRSSSS